ncbi:hypothetical protein D910_02105 [Dendroctonus ponderosae]|uniref:Uncharacterized protein n=1 Tax=Dendroctonus ponderosae TaxID=77166 RepID=U4TXF1_DENPD|nr:hypothetical protein D910_02105 [Dendroctonus ponderosae]KAH1027176.1 hypothetical protein HUJ05_000735 [Dendroctonus ponderosae]
MDVALMMGLILMVVYIIAQISFITYSQAAYKALRNEIISKGRLISFFPVLTVSTVNTIHDPALAHQPIPGAPPRYSTAAQSKPQPPPYMP